MDVAELCNSEQYDYDYRKKTTRTGNQIRALVILMREGS